MHARTFFLPSSLIHGVGCSQPGEMMQVTPGPTPLISKTLFSVMTACLVILTCDCNSANVIVFRPKFPLPKCIFQFVKVVFLLSAKKNATAMTKCVCFPAASSPGLWISQETWGLWELKLYRILHL